MATPVGGTTLGQSPLSVEGVCCSGCEINMTSILPEAQSLAGKEVHLDSLVQSAAYPALRTCPQEPLTVGLWGS